MQTATTEQPRFDGERCNVIAAYVLHKVIQRANGKTLVMILLEGSYGTVAISTRVSPAATITTTLMILPTQLVPRSSSLILFQSLYFNCQLETQ